MQIRGNNKHKVPFIALFIEDKNILVYNHTIDTCVQVAVARARTHIRTCICVLTYVCMNYV